jgi:purine-nucleoside phosphorylase
MSELHTRIDEAVAAVRKHTTTSPNIGIILGTGLGPLADAIVVETAIDYPDIPHFAHSTVEGHAGRLLFGTVGGKSVVAMQGRFHHYEGYSFEQVTFPVRVMRAIGVDTLVVSNACGGMNPQFAAGDLMVITDHINFTGGNPLIGPNDDSLGPRFPDMSEPYDRELIALAEKTALYLGIKLHRGVYVGVAGPTLETGAEYRMLRFFGADVVGMSTVPEVIVALHGGMKVLGFSVITDMGLPDALEQTSHEIIVGVANKAAGTLSKLLAEVVRRM